ncbi:MAG: SDR family oxidoreductase [Thermoanaerobaculia bacterium]
MAKSDVGRIAVVTGGSRGIGRAIVEAFLGEGWRVYLCSRRQESVDRALGELAGSYGAESVNGRAVDVGSEEEVEELARWVLGETGGRVDCLVNNAGVGHFAPVDELTGEQWRDTLATNLSGPFYCVRAFAPAMKRRGSGWIVNIASLAAKNPFAGGAAYNASKFGLVGFSEAAMLDLRQHGVRVASILPGSVETGFGRGRSGAGWKLAPEDVAAMVLHLLTYPDRALPSLVEMRPTRPPKR